MLKERQNSEIFSRQWISRPVGKKGAILIIVYRIQVAMPSKIENCASDRADFNLPFS